MVSKNDRVFIATSFSASTLASTGLSKCQTTLNWFQKGVEEQLHPSKLDFSSINLGFIESEHNRSRVQMPIRVDEIFAKVV